MRTPLRAALALLTFLIPVVASAQDGRIQLEILDKLAARASEKQEITLGPELLASVSPALVQQGAKSDAAKQVLTKLRGVFVRNYEFADPNAYSMDDIKTIRQQLTKPGWMRIVSNEEKKKDGTFELQEIYILQADGRTNGIVILNAEPRELSVVNIVGTIDFAELASLAGVLGIPPVSGIPH
jgi:hypothetical protein